MRSKILSLALAVALGVVAQQPDPDFYIYPCIGQSNMEGAGQIELQDHEVPDNFVMMAAVDYPQAREKGQWYAAVPPLVRSSSGLGPTDYFGRTMAENLPDKKIGVVCVAIGGCKIEHLDKDYDPATVVNEADWFRSFMACYDNEPYKRLIECAKEAQKDGVIKGILLHQGESNTGDQLWPAKVNKVYNDILADLNLNAEDVPLFAGEVVTSEVGGACGSMNPIINTLPETVQTAHVVSAADLPHRGDHLHFTSHAYRLFGGRYAAEALKCMGIENPVISYTEDLQVKPTPKPSEGDFIFNFRDFNPRTIEDGTFDHETNVFSVNKGGFGGWNYDTPIDLSGYQFIVAELEEPQSENLTLRVYDTASFWEVPFSIEFGDKTLVVADLDGMMKPKLEMGQQSGIQAVNTAKVYRVGFRSETDEPIKIKQVYVTNTNPYTAKR